MADLRLVRRTAETLRNPELFELVAILHECTAQEPFENALGRASMAVHPQGNQQ
jgi:hypothetical protein